MDYSEAIKHALNGQAMVFLGAGFASEAYNLANENLPRAKDLARKLCRLVDEDETDDLYLASQMYENENGVDNLISFLTTTFTIKDTCEHQDVLATVPWKSVYTTNYDNVYSVSCAKNGKKCTLVTLSNAPTSLPPTAHKIVHINGAIQNLNRDTINNEFKLTITGYVNATSIISSPWCDELLDDIRLAKSIFFVGYSMYDLDIKRIFGDHDSIKHKSFFILDKVIDRGTKILVDIFGINTNKSVKDFANDIVEAQKAFVPSNTEFIFSSFENLKYDQYKKPQGELSKLVFDTYTLGYKNDYDVTSAIEERKSKQCYIFRQELEDFIGNFENNGLKNSLYISDFGNGKTFLLYGVISYALTKGIPCYIFKENTGRTLEEIKKISEEMGKQIIIFENFERHIDIISKFEQNRTSRAYLILTSRTTFAETFFERLPPTIREENFTRIIDTLHDNELHTVIDIFEGNGLWGEYASKSKASKLHNIRNNNGACFSRILLDVLNSQTIRDMINGLCREAEKSNTISPILLAMAVFSKLNFRLSLQQILRYIKIKVNNIIAITTNPVLRQLCDFSDSSAGIKSSVLANNILQEHLPGEQIVNILIKIYESSTQVEDRHSKNIQHALGRFSEIQSILPASKKLENCIRYFDSIMKLNNNASNYHFWLQYAITLTVFNRFSEANTRFKTAYSFLNAKQDDTFQIDNHYARFLLKRAIEDPAYSSYEYFREANIIVMRQIHMEKTLHFPYRPASHYKKYYEQYNEHLTTEEREHFIKQCNHILSITAKYMGKPNINKSITDCHETIKVLLDKLS